MAFIIALLLAIPIAAALYFLAGTISRRIAKPDELQGLSDEEKEDLAKKRANAGLPPIEPKVARLFVTPEANTTGFIVKQRTDSGGSTIIGVIPRVPNKVLRIPDPDNLESCYYEDGAEKLTMWERRFGPMWTGIFNQLRANTVRELRVVLDVPSGQYKLVGKEYSELNFVHYSRELAVKIENAETQSRMVVENGQPVEKPGYRVNAIIVLKYVEKYPVRARLAVADGNSFLTGLTTEAANGKFKEHPSAYFVYGGTKNQKELTDAVLAAVSNKVAGAEKVLGLEVTEAVLHDIGVPDDIQAKFQAEQDAELLGNARVMEEKKNAETAEVAIQTAKNKVRASNITAIGERFAGLRQVEVEAARAENVHMYLGQNPQAVLSKLGDDVRDSKLTSLVLGGNISQLIPSGAPTPVEPSNTGTAQPSG